MHNFLAVVLILFGGWTLSSHAAVLSGASLNTLIILAPIVITLLGITYFYLVFSLKNRRYISQNIQTRVSATQQDLPASSLLLSLLLIPITLYFSWLLFWLGVLLILIYCVTKQGLVNPLTPCRARKLQCREWLVVLSLSIVAILLTLSVSRSDLDDAFYVAVAAFTAEHAFDPLLVLDPMHGEQHLPLLFPSYRFAAFELFSGALAYLFDIPPIDVIHRILPPFWAVITVFCIFLLSQELLPRHWLLLGTITLFLTIFLGECHRGPANFAFVRLFQGKALYLSAIMPAIYYLTARYFSPRGTSADLLLLACTQIASIGLTNFGMLAAPMALFGALLANVAYLNQISTVKLWRILLIFLIPVPYLLNVFFSTRGMLPPAAYGSTETAANVWLSVFGKNQQYLIVVLLLLGPILTKDKLLRCRLAIPLLLLFAIYLNPWLSAFIANKITTPPVYWRVVWSFPLLTWSATGLSLLIINMFKGKNRTIYQAILSVVITVLLIQSAPLTTLRTSNGISWNYAGKKIPDNHYQVAEAVIKHIGDNKGRLLAPEEIASTVSMFKSHPVLVNVRSMYTEILAHAMTKEEYTQRQLLNDFVSGLVKSMSSVSIALDAMQVTSIILHQRNLRLETELFLVQQGFTFMENKLTYSIWVKKPL